MLDLVSDLNPRNLFRITWKNEPVASGGGFGGVNYLDLPSELTGVETRIVMLVGKYFPTGAHKVGATFGPLVEKLIRGAFDPTTQKALWPSTGNYCRGGAFDSYLMDTTAVAILPEEMSRERFDWLRDIGAEVIATPGCESNVKEIYDKCWEIKHHSKDCVIFNQFEEFGNAIWHYHLTGSIIEEIWQRLSKPGDRLALELPVEEAGKYRIHEDGNGSTKRSFDFGALLGRERLGLLFEGVVGPGQGAVAVLEGLVGVCEGVVGPGQLVAELDILVVGHGDQAAVVLDQAHREGEAGRRARLVSGCSAARARSRRR